MRQSCHILIVFLVSSFYCFSQGHIERIKNQPYLKLKNKVNCNDTPGDNLSMRICANLAFQKSDSLLCVIYYSIFDTAPGSGIDSLKQKVIKMQDSWRMLRDQHCSIIMAMYEDCGGCHKRAIEYLNCLTELTCRRIWELQKLAEETGLSKD